MNSPLLQVENLSINFRTENGLVEAVKRVSLSLEHGGSLAIVGESGSGKSVTALSLARLLPTPPAEFASGSIHFEGRDILAMSPAELRAVRGGGIAYVFQEPATSLNAVVSFCVATATESVAVTAIGALDLLPVTSLNEPARLETSSE